MELVVRIAAWAAVLACTVALLTLVAMSVPVSKTLASTVAQNGAQAVALMAFPAAALVLAKWQNFQRKDYAFAFFLALFAMIAMQVPVQIGGMTGWGPNLVLLSGVGKWTLFVSAALFARAMLKGDSDCPPWGWALVVATTLVLAWAI